MRLSIFARDLLVPCYFAPVFRRVIEQFEGTGGVSSLIPEPILTTYTEARINAVRQYFKIAPVALISPSSISTFHSEWFGEFFGRISSGNFINSKRCRSWRRESKSRGLSFVDGFSLSFSFPLSLSLFLSFFFPLSLSSCPLRRLHFSNSVAGWAVTSLPHHT